MSKSQLSSHSVDFLSGLEEGTLQEIEAMNTDICSRLKTGLVIFQAKDNLQVLNDRALINVMIDKLEEAEISRLARQLRETYL